MEQEHEYTNEEATKFLTSIKSAEIKVRIIEKSAIFIAFWLSAGAIAFLVSAFLLFNVSHLVDGWGYIFFVIAFLCIVIISDYYIFRFIIHDSQMYYFKQPSVIFVKSLYNLTGNKFMYYINNDKNVLLRYKEWQINDEISKSLNKLCLSGELKTVHKKDYDKIICRKPKKCKRSLKNKKAILYIREGKPFKFMFGGGWIYEFIKINEPIAFTMPLQLKEKMIEEGYEVPEGLDITWVDTTKEKIRY